MKFDKLIENIIGDVDKIRKSSSTSPWHPGFLEKGWRYLSSMEIIQAGDERYNYLHDEWTPVPPNWIGEECDKEIIRTLRK